MINFLNADDDWMEQVRAYLWPKLHPLIELFGGYSIGHVTAKQYVTTFDSMDEETFEGVLTSIGFERNPISCYKTDNHDHNSTGSWALRADADPNGVLTANRQLHITLFHDEAGGSLEVYAHEEYDWMDRPFAHLRSKKFQPVEGREYMARLLREHGVLA